MEKLVGRALFIIGWLLSPFTFWNDALINIPIAYFFASLCIKIFPAHFLLLTLVFYWLSNIAGLAIMYLSGQSIAKGKGGISTILIYSVLIAFLYIIGMLKPF